MLKHNTIKIAIVIVFTVQAHVRAMDNTPHDAALATMSQAALQRIKERMSKLGANSSTVERSDIVKEEMEKALDAVSAAHASGPVAGPSQQPLPWYESDDEENDEKSGAISGFQVTPVGSDDEEEGN